MKANLSRILAVVFVVLLTTGPVPADVKYVIGVKGLSCPFCAYGLEKKLKKLEHVHSVSINMNKGEAVIIARDPIEESALRKAVKGAGFTLYSLEEDAADRAPETDSEGDTRQ